MGDVGLNYMPHTIAFNIWAGPNAQLPPQGSAGLQYFVLQLPDQDQFDALRKRLIAANAPVAEIDDMIATRDPFGNELRIAIHQA